MTLQDNLRISALVDIEEPFRGGEGAPVSHAPRRCSAVAFGVMDNITKVVDVIMVGTAGPLQGKVPHDLLRSQAQGRAGDWGAPGLQLEITSSGLSGGQSGGHRLRARRGPIRHGQPPLQRVRLARGEGEAAGSVYCFADTWTVWLEGHVSAEIALALRWFTDSSFI